mmetsp:Transcript_10863/g.30774  ORF Transcript_10863/g.30774 Transcript_10863/m.30774 type:complete len:200 (-) Transcript_10863:750-1349(-)
MPPSRKQILRRSSLLKYFSTSCGEGVAPEMIFCATSLVSTEPSKRQTSSIPCSSVATCSASHETSDFSTCQCSFCWIAVDFSIFSAGAAGSGAGGFLTCSANSRKRSTCLPSADLFRITSSQSFRACSLMSVYRGRPPGFTMDMLRPFGIAWCRNTLCIASRREFRPRKEKERLLRPPLKETQGQVRLISATALMKSSA